MKDELTDLANLVTAAHSALEHVRELRDAWQRGIIIERDQQGGTRSNRNHDVDIALRNAVAPYVAHAIHKMLRGCDWFQAVGIAGGDIIVYLKLRRGEKDPTLQKMIREGFDGLLVRAEYVGKVKLATQGEHGDATQSSYSLDDPPRHAGSARHRKRVLRSSVDR